MYILTTSFTVFTLKLFNLIIFTKRSVLDVEQGSEYASNYEAMFWKLMHKFENTF